MKQILERPQEFQRARQAKAQADLAKAEAMTLAKNAQPLPAVKERVPGRVWDVLSSDESRYYQVCRNDGDLTDNCPAGRHGRPCRHKRLIERLATMEDAGQIVKPDTRPFVAVADPEDADPFFPHPAEVLIPLPLPVPALKGPFGQPVNFDPSYEYEVGRRSLSGYLQAA